ncbi:beta-1,4-galactosyltransferase 2-like isoform X1 [Daphnia pulicaria]|uniref:beta-1,4-galactosyltransferase 2-like isoform X1 n=1 Tax=Daphnia pulicaria TaxID=35523 RepID=UPI001EEC5685|nr:beta-1,4-galactosyltransferase 2-like isoform X1 [Daphnia pulicaria]
MTMPRLGVLLRRVFLPLGLFLVFFHVTKMDAFTNILWPSNVNRSESSSGVNSTPIIDHQQRQPPCFKYLSAGPIRLVINTTLPTDEELNELFPHIQMGGHWHPEHCHPRQRLGIFVPMKRRWHQLPIFLRHLHQVLVSQWRHYTIFVVEQADGDLFNRGKLLNAGVIEALRIHPDLDCFILHDVDTLPETNYAVYKCHEDRQFALQMATYQSKRDYLSAYKGYAGGVLAVRRSQFEDVNGFSNEFWGWGGEDDDFGNRLRNKSYRVYPELSRGGYFYSLHHPPEQPNPLRDDIIRKHKSSHLHGEGLDSVKYVVLKSERRRLYTFLSVSILQGPARDQLAAIGSSSRQEERKKKRDLELPTGETAS